MGVVLVLLMWLTLSAVMVGMMWAFPAMHLRRPPLHQRSWLCRLLAGEMAVRGSVRIGLGISGALWWIGAAGVLNSDAVRGGAVFFSGIIVLVSLFNAGRRAPLSLWGYMCLGGFLGACLLGLFLLAVELVAYLLGCGVTLH
ncbi:TPA: hypothetical protein ACKP36_004392 [Serratia marcescens]|uniref:hypothetical protein n=1 Tax=Serratia marcescens TaxID=615 RepID=UPI00301BF997